MRWIAEAAEIGVMRSGNYQPSRGRQQPVKLLYGSDDVGHMLNQMNGPHLAERIVGERERKLVEVGHNIGACVRIAVDANGARVFVNAAANVENRQLARCYCSNGRRHCYSVPTSAADADDFDGQAVQWQNAVYAAQLNGFRRHAKNNTRLFVLREVEGASLFHLKHSP